MMTITIDGGLEAAIRAEAAKTGAVPEGLALDALRERFHRPKSVEEREEWLRQLRALAIPAGVSLPNEAFLGEALYE